VRDFEDAAFLMVFKAWDSTAREIYPIHSFPFPFLFSFSFSLSQKKTPPEDRQATVNRPRCAHNNGINHRPFHSTRAIPPHSF